MRFAVSHTIPASNQAVWQVLGDFGTEHRWTRSVVNCHRNTAQVGVGTVRSCALPRPLMGRTHAIERLVEFEQGEALAYQLDGPAGPFATVSSRWSTRAISPYATEVTVEGRFTPRHFVARAVVWPMAKPMLRRLTRDVLSELEAFVLAQRGEL
jgi:hypothetical protein